MYSTTEPAKWHDLCIGELILRKPSQPQTFQIVNLSTSYNQTRKVQSSAKTKPLARAFKWDTGTGSCSVIAPGIPGGANEVSWHLHGLLVLRRLLIASGGTAIGVVLVYVHGRGGPAMPSAEPSPLVRDILPHLSLGKRTNSVFRSYRRVPRRSSCVNGHSLASRQLHA